MKPKNLAQLRKFLQPGVTLRLVQAPYFKDGDPALTRVVKGSNTVDCKFTGDGINEGQTSYMSWGKAGDYQFTEQGFTITRSGNVLRYEYVEPNVADAPERDIAPGVICKCHIPGAFCPMHGRRSPS